jgi:hypothetical protein
MIMMPGVFSLGRTQVKVYIYTKTQGVHKLGGRAEFHVHLGTGNRDSAPKYNFGPSN